MMEVSALILAAGAGTRMRSKYPKVLHKICGRSMIGWVLECCRQAGISHTAAVLGSGMETVRTELGDRVECFIQSEQLGTGHAVMCAGEFIDGIENIVVLYGDVPLLAPETLKSLINTHIAEKNDVTVLTAVPKDPTGYGRIIKDGNGRICGIKEHRDASPDELHITEINSGMAVFGSKPLKEALKKLGNGNSQNEYYLTDTIGIIYSAGGRTGTYVAPCPEEIQGVNDRVQLASAEKTASALIMRRHMLAGVTIEDPESTRISADAEISSDVTLFSGTRIEGKSRIDEDSVIGPGTRISDSAVGRGTRIENSVVINSRIGNNTSVGPFAYIRPESVIGDDVKIGDFVEIKKSIIGNHTKISHLSYVGDAIIGTNCNLGCGVVVVNYDGKKKNTTIIGDNAFIGCNVNLVAPVEVERDTYIAAGSTITMRVPEKALAIARERQTNIENWVERKNMLRK